MIISLVCFERPTQEIIPLVSFFAFAGYRLMPALQEIFNSLTVIKFNKAVLDKIHKDMLEGGLKSDNLPLGRKKHSLLGLTKEIQLENIGFSYPGNSKEVLKNISLIIKKNTSVAFIGTTGSGKTTLIDIILGLFIPDRGKLKVDGAEINKNNIKNWQANLGYVPQQIYLSDDTITRNIAFGLQDEDINMDRVKKVAEMANINRFIEQELPEKYNTFIGERGIRLSGGQKQRLGIARALYHDPQILLFDEATSSLDNATEKEVMSAIEGIAKIKTIIIIAHRLTTVRNCDRVYVMKKGEVISEGSFSEIINRNQELNLE